MSILLTTLLILFVSFCYAQQDCVCGAWSDWGQCSAGCGGGEYQRTRACTAPSSGQLCTTDALGVSELAQCNTQPCVMTCQACGNWAAWSECTAACDSGTRTHTRTCAANTTRDCTTETLPCPGMAPCACNCTVWSGWGACSENCGGGTRNRTRSCIANCQGATSADSEACNQDPCPPCPGKRCEDWAPWGLCNTKCGVGTRNTTRFCVTNTSESCGYDTLDSVCEGLQCPPEDCQCQPWSSWTACSAACGTGVHYQTRKCLPAKAQGRSCASLGLMDVSEPITCTVRACVQQSSNKLSTGAVGGLVVAGIGAALLLCAAGYFASRQRNRLKQVEVHASERGDVSKLAPSPCLEEEIVRWRAETAPSRPLSQPDPR